MIEDESDGAILKEIHAIGYLWCLRVGGDLVNNARRNHKGFL